MLIKEGVSLNTDKWNSDVQKYGGAFEVDQNTIPDGLKITQKGKPGHYEIQPTRDMKEAEFLELMDKVEVKPSNSLD